MNILGLGDGASTAVRSSFFLDAVDGVHRRMHRWRSNSQAWSSLLNRVFGRSGSVELAGITVQCLGAQEMPGLRGAYVAKSQGRDETIFLNNDWLATASTPEIESVLLEEIGHAIDFRLHGMNDSDGDEGAVFSAMIRGVNLPLGERNQEDQHLLEIDNMRVAVEASASRLSGVAVLASIAENTINSHGNTVVNLFSSAFSSDSGRSFEAIAIIANRADASTEGVWQYSLAPHLDWLTVPTSGLADSSALYLTGATKIRFVPNSGFVGQPGEMSVHLVDQSFVVDEDISFGTVSVNPFGLSQLDGTSGITPAFADLDADGDVDGFIGGDRSDSNGVFDMYLNTGTPSRPSFSAGIANAFQVLDSRSGSGYFIPTFVDIDNDGDLDLFAANESNKVIDYYENQGSPASPDFAQAVSNPFGLVAPDAVVGISIKFADIDNDGDLDVVIGGDVGPGYAFNIGTSESPQFEDAFHLMYKWNYQDVSGGTVFPEFVDVENNGVLDMFATYGFNSDGDIAYFKNSGTTSTPDFATVVYNPFGLNPGETFASGDSFSSITQFVDLNDDGLMDLLMGSEDGGNIGYFPNTSSQSGATVDVSNYGDNSAVSSQMVDLNTAVTSRNSDVELVLQDDHSFYVDSELNSGLWLDLNVQSSNAVLQNSLVLVDQTGQVLASVGATQSSGNLGRQSVFIPGGSKILFQQSSNEKAINETPLLRISEQADNAFKIQLEDGSDDDYDDLIVELTPMAVSSRNDTNSMAIHQSGLNDSIIDFHSPANAEKTIEITLNSDSGFKNRFALVELTMGNDGSFTVDGLTGAAGDAFDQAVRDRLINPGGEVISTTGVYQQVIRWTLSSVDAGYYAPVLINPSGNIFTYGADNVKTIGNNTFGFEDLLLSDLPDWDYNDLVVRFDVI